MRAMKAMVVLAAYASAMAVGWPAYGAEADEGTTEKKIPVFRLRGPIVETPPPEFPMFGFGEERRHALKDIVARINRAEKDPKVVGILLTLEDPVLGWAQVQELREAILRVRAANKDVYCHIEAVGQGGYLLASAASRLSISPTGTILLMGMRAQSPYVKGLLDKVHVDADFLMIGEYKGAAEPLTREGPSPEAEEQINWLMDDLYEQMVEAIAETRALSPERVKELIDQGPYTAERALKADLVDVVEYRQDFRERIERKHGSAAKLVKRYGEKEGPEVDFSSPFAFFEFLGKMMRPEESKGDSHVALVYVDGMIVRGRSEESLFGERIAGSTTIRAALDKARKDKDVKAVVLRVDSPGGSALASEIILHAAKLCGAEKPLIVSMGNVAASGGYYVSCGAETIFADPSTITGSIGVVGGKIVLKGLWDWAGISFYETKRGANADLFSMQQRFTEEQRAFVQKMLEEIYAVFTKHVTEGRGEKLSDDIEKIARGRVYTGRMAKAKGLVDEIGGLEAAVAHAAKAAGLDKYEIRVIPRPKGFLDLFKEGFGIEDEDDEASARSAASRQRWAITSPAVELAGAVLRQVKPAEARMVVRTLMRLDMLRRESALTVLPTEFMIGGMGW